MSIMTPVILCGGSGTRLWPRSRKTAPKPFINLIGDSSLFCQAVDRCSSALQFADPVIVAGEAHVTLIEQQMGSERPYSLLVEPVARNTAPAIALAAASLDPDAIMLVCPSDHHIADPAAFVQAACVAAELARDDWLVSFGIAPDRPETGYGYIQQGEAMGGGYRVQKFVEKPDLATAEAFLATGGYAWNGGIFAFKAGHLLTELARHRPDMAHAVELASSGATRQGKTVRPDADAFASIAGESIDYAVMENTAHAAMVPVSMGWSDIGNWAAVHDALKQDKEGNHAGDKHQLEDCRNVLVLSDGKRVSALGLEDVCIVVDGDDILVTRMDRAQDVGRLKAPSSQ